MFFILATAYGLDGVILDPLDEVMMGNLLAAKTLLGKDEYCMEYLAAAREGRLNFVSSRK